MTAFAVFAFVIFPILFFVYFRCTQKYVNPYKLIFIFGKKGSGKSTLLTKYVVGMSILQKIVLVHIISVRKMLVLFSFLPGLLSSWMRSV